MKILYNLIIALLAIVAAVSLLVVAILISSTFHINLLVATLIVALLLEIFLGRTGNNEK